MRSIFLFVLAAVLAACSARAMQAPDAVHFVVAADPHAIDPLRIRPDISGTEVGLRAK